MRHSRSLLALLISVAGAIAGGTHVYAADPQNYEIGIAGMLFDPKTIDPAVSTRAPMTKAELDKHKAQASHYIVQLYSSPSAEVRRHLAERYSAQLKEYLPNLSYIEKLDPAAAEAAAKDAHIRAVIPFQPSFKLSPAIGTLVPRTAERKAIKGLLLRAVLFRDADPRAAAEAIIALGASDVKILDDRQHTGGVARVRFVLPSADQLAAVARVDGLRWIEEVGEVIDDDIPASGTLQSGHNDKTPVWDVGLHGEGQIIGIIDGGKPDLNHCFFKDPSNNDPRPSHRKVVLLRNTSKSEPARHATFTAGNAAGDDFQTPGVHRHRGSAWASRLAVGNNVDISNGDSTMRAELSAAADAGAAIHTNSWHDNTHDPVHGKPALYNQTAVDVDTFTWFNEDHLVLGSAGNYFEEEGPPGTSKNAIGVAASHLGQVSLSFGDGNPGPTADGRRKPDLASPGCGVYSAKFNTPCQTWHLSACATSFATPHAAGAAALVRQYFMEGWYPTGARRASDAFTPSGALLKAMLVGSTINMTGAHSYPNNLSGWGLIRLDNVLFFEGGVHRVQIWDTRNGDGLTTGETRTHVISVADGTRPLKVALVWTEPPAALGAAKTLINNLDLALVSPDGAQTFLGNVFEAGTSAPGGAPDTLNNVEVALVRAPAVGTWTAKVHGTDISVGNPGQGYALVATGGLAVPSVASIDKGTAKRP